MMAKVARSLRITGHVQGVFFRAWTQHEADALGLGGWVRNCSDGSVEAHVEGEAGDVQKLVDLTREGPPGARVDDVEVGIADPEGLTGFDVRG
jgi:acylphosphatase